MDDASPGGEFDFLSDCGEMGDRIRAYDWGANPLGPPASWPPALRGALAICLSSSFPTAIYWGPEFRLLYNDAWSHVPAERHPWALGRPAREVWADIWDVIEPQLAEVAERGKGLSFYDQHLPMKREGVVRETYWNYSFSPLRGEDGTVQGVFNQGHETTARVLHDRRREAETERQRKLFEKAPGFITVLRGPEHRYEFVNDAYRLVFGDRDYIGRTAREVFPELEGQGIVEVLDRVYASGERFVARGMPIRVVREKLGEEELYVDYMYEPIIDEHGAVTGLFCEGSDSTEAHRAVRQLREDNESLEERVAARTRELSEANEALRHAQKMEAVGQLTGGIAHDFNNLLAAIGGSLEVLERRIREGVTEGLDRYIAGARQSADRAAALTQRLLAFSRRQTLDPKPTDIAALVEGLEEMIQHSVGPAIAVSLARREGPWISRVDAGQLENALLNLAINARDAMPDGGDLTFEVSREQLDEDRAARNDLPLGDYVSITVTDTGVGIPADLLDRIFDPFFTTKPLGEGTGLGLSMVHGFVRQSGGQVEVASALDKGTVVRLLLPLAAETPAAPRSAAAPAKAAGASAGHTILVVDDEVIVRMLMVEVLEEAGYTIIEAHDGASALRALEDAGARVDLLVSDVGLPGGMNGRQLADAVRAALPGLGVLFVTGYADMRVVEGSEPVAGIEVLAKPFTADDLLRRVAALIVAGRA